MATTTETIGQEVHNSFDFYGATSNQATISKFYLTGGCMMVPKIMSEISRAVGAPGEVLDPFRNITVKNRKFTSEYIHQIKPFAAIVLGLGLRREGDR
jgi:type IV pilus assembly protein PilM